MTSKPGPLRVHVLFEYAGDHRREPHGCGFIRLLRPLSHPSVADRIRLTSGLDLPDEGEFDVVIIERLWDNVARSDRFSDLLRRMRRRGIPYIYEIDDDLINVNARAGDRLWPNLDQRLSVRRLARQADGVIVSTNSLKREFLAYNPHVEVVPNYLDERLFTPGPRPVRPDDGTVVFGYMGTYTHLEDLMGIIAPLRRVLHRERHRVRFELVGVGHREELEALMPGLPVTLCDVPVASVPYIPFVQWMIDNLAWDFAIAPLHDSRFARSKSDIKFLDYSALGIPGIYSDVEAYRHTVEDGRTGLLVPEDSAAWEAALHGMIDDRARRLEMAAAAEAKVRSSRMLETQAHEWLDAITRIVEGHAARKADAQSA